jgi:putative membrane protein
MKKIFIFFVRISAFILLFILALQNTQKVTFVLFFDYIWQAPLILILSVFFGLGLLFGGLLLVPYLWRQRKILRTYTKHHPNEYKLDKESSR